MPTDVFMNPKKHPSDAALRKKLGGSYKLFEQVSMSIQFDHDGIGFEWKFSKTSGWYLICLRKKRRLFYLIPRETDFLFRMLFGPRAVAAIKKSEFSSDIQAKLKSAKKYPEGTLLDFERSNFDVGSMLKLLTIKIEN